MIFLTFDYELFFGRSGTVEKSILEPTELLLQLMSEYDVFATFFVDASFLFTLNKSQTSTTIEKSIIEQLKRILEAGHRVEPHIHSHWIDAIPFSDQWKFPTYEHYKLQSLGFNEGLSYFTDVATLLLGICQKVDTKYRFNAYRAGGWCINPFPVFKKAFKEFGIIIDSSIAPGIQLSNEIFDVNFKHAPKKPAWWFNDDPLKPDFTGEILEVPITTYRRSVLTSMTMQKPVPTRIGDGTTISFPSSRHIKMLNSIFRYRLLSFEYARYEELKAITRKRKTALFISHPKNMSMEDMKCFSRFLYDHKGEIISLMEAPSLFRKGLPV